MPARFVRVADLKKVPAGSRLCADADGTPIALYGADGKIFATSNTCPHAGGPLCEGTLSGGVVTCPWHGSKFNVATGEVVNGPATVPVRTFPVEVRGDDIFVGLPETAEKPKAVKLSFAENLDKEHPFSYEPFINDIVAGLKFPFKLYGPIDLLPIAQNPDEMDFFMGEIHATEADLKKLSELMTTLNAKWGTDITYCLFLSEQFPNQFLLNIRGPKAPMNLSSDIRY